MLPEFTIRGLFHRRNSLILVTLVVAGASRWKDIEDYLNN